MSFVYIVAIIAYPLKLDYSPSTLQRLIREIGYP